MVTFDFSKLWDIPVVDRQIGLESFDAIRVVEWNNFYINVTVFNSWLVILLITLTAWLTTRNLSTQKQVSKWQTALESLVLWLQQEANETSGSRTNQYLGMAMGMFCFILVCNLLTFIPWFRPPTASLSTTMALAFIVFLAIPYFSIKNAGLKGYLKKFIDPIPLMLPMNIFSEFFSVFAMGLRLFGNMLSGVMFASILSAFVPFIAPLTMQTLGLLTGSIQAYIFALLAVVYSSSVKEEIVPQIITN
ncbi:MAG: F0F1 ATP synthase subunit A [Alphaproteobacteria bacterium]|nr:F0F1 ATP synthase subunit A [Alphaproteobacteria bacterium]MBR1756368.1 F0F1 ATP synthase subunit A [Alphaproteobacteria bacterium]